MDEEKQLKNALSWQYKSKQTESLLGEEIHSYLKHRHRALVKNASVIDAWKAVVPSVMQPFCQLDKRVGNTLYLRAQPGPYLHQAQMLSEELLEKIKQQAPCCGIQKIKVLPIKNDIVEQ